MQKLFNAVSFSELIGQTLVRKDKTQTNCETTVHLECRKKILIMIKMQLRPGGKPLVSVVRGVHNDIYPHPIGGYYHLH